MKKNQYYFLSAAVALFFFFVDFFTKRFAENMFTDSFIIIPHFFRLSFHQNTGVAFSLPVPQIFQIFLTIFLLALLFHFFWKSKKNILISIAFGCVVGGALGNFYDRIFVGAVTDFLSIWHFPVFNIADVAIFCGVCLFLLNEYLAKKEVQ